jgi:hypothetical protein
VVARRFVQEAAEALGVAPECVATTVLGACAAAIGNTCRIRISSNWTEPAVLWLVTLMESGSLKTPAYNIAFAPLKAAQQRREEEYIRRQQEYRDAKARYEAQIAAWNATGGEGGQAQPVKPVEPKPVDLYTSDATVEALGVLFANNPRGLALARDELSGFFDSFGAYKGGRGGDEAAYLEFYNAGGVKLNRASGKRIWVAGAALTIVGTCQPPVFAAAIGAGGLHRNQVENGLAARFLIAAPESRPKVWRDAKPIQGRHYHAMIDALLAIPLLQDAEGRVDPAMIKMQPAAAEYFANFVAEHGRQTASIRNAALRYHYAKLEGVAARIALIFYLCDAATQQVTGEPGVQWRHIVAGVAVARWFGREATRVYEGIDGAAEREKRDLLEEIRANGGTITVREMRTLARRWRAAAAAESALYALVRCGYGAIKPDPSGPKGGAPTLRFTLTDQQPVTEPPESADRERLATNGT